MQPLNLTTTHSDHPSSGAMKEKHVLGQLPAFTDGSPDLYPTVPDDGCMELLWEKGQIVMQGLSSNRTNQAQEVPTASVRSAQGKEAEQTNKITANQEDEMDLRLDYPIDDLYWEFLHDVSGMDLSSFSPPTPTDHRIPSYGQVERDAAGTHPSEDAGTSRSVVPAGYLQPNNTSQVLQHHCSQTFTSSGSTPKDSDLRTGSSDQRPSNGGLPTKMQTPEYPTSIKPIQPSSSAPLIMNFSHFSRLAAMVKSNLQFVDRMSGGGSEAACTHSSGSATGSKLMESASEFRRVPAIFRGQVTSVACNSNESAQPAIQDSALFHHPNPICQEQDATRINTSNYNYETNSTRIPSHGSSFPCLAVAGKHGVEKPPKPPTVSTSMCSANGVGTSSNDDKNRAKWESQEGDESKYQSEDFEDDSTCTRKLITGKSVSTKRSRGRTGVYNLSERRRRDRINERIRALRRLVPNCTKVDKASTLDEAIKYLKTLQMQLQVMSMCSGLHMMPMMGAQPIHPPHAGPLPPVGASMGVGMAMGMGFGMGMLDMTGSLPVPMVPVANMHGPHYPYGSLPVTTAGLHGRMPGTANLRQVFGMPGQAQAAQLSMAMPHPPSFSPSMVNPTSQPPVAMAPQPAILDAAPPNSKNQQWIQPLLEPLPRETGAARGRPQLATPRQA